MASSQALAPVTVGSDRLTPAFSLLSLLFLVTFMGRGGETGFLCAALALMKLSVGQADLELTEIHLPLPPPPSNAGIKGLGHCHHHPAGPLLSNRFAISGNHHRGPLLPGPSLVRLLLLQAQL